MESTYSSCSARRSRSGGCLSDRKSDVTWHLT